MKPNDFPRRTLLAVTGMSPQVVTETLFALVTERGFVPTDIRIITTENGRNRLVRDLLDERDGHFHAFCREYDLSGKIRFDASCIDVIRDASGVPLPDIRTPQENNQAADAIVGIVQGLCQDAMRALHVSIAGGRKSMGFFLGYALSLFARPQDQASHVLVSEPYESNRDFFYPSGTPRMLVRADGSKLDAANAKVMLADIPIVRLRSGLPNELLVGQTSYSTAVATAQAEIAPPIQMSFDLEKRCLILGGQSVRMAPILLAFMLWMARLRCARQVARLNQPEAVAGFLVAYADVVGDWSQHYENARHTMPDGFAQRAQEFASRIKGILLKKIGSRATPYLVNGIGNRPHTSYTLELPLECICLRSA